MNVLAEQSRSLWMEASAPLARALEIDTRADVLVIGSGIAGLSCAYELADAGRKVVVVDRGPIAGGMTARTSAHLSFEFDDYFHELIRLRGAAEARQYYESQRAAVERIEEICRRENIECDFARVDGYLCAATASDRSLLEDELEACRRIGFEEVEPARSPLGDAEALRFKHQARFHPLKYLDELASVITTKGGTLFADSPVVNIEEGREGVNVALANDVTITAHSVIVATNSPISNTVAVHTKQAPYRTYVLATPVPKGSVPDALIWDTLDPYHYVRLQPRDADDLLIVGGEDHKSGTKDDGVDRIARLYEWTKQHWPSVGAIKYAWSGQVYEPVDAVPYIGRAPGMDRVFIVTGDSGEGLTTGVAASLVLRDLVNDRKSPWSEVYDPSRKTLRSVGTYLHENLDVAANLTEHVHDSQQLKSFDDVPAGSGAIVNHDGKKVAAYRDANGELHLRSATCTHVGCIVHWNSFERCWDCPCHGSQFSVSGEALTGPAMKPLAPLETIGPGQRAAGPDEVEGERKGGPEARGSGARGSSGHPPTK